MTRDRHVQIRQVLDGLPDYLTLLREKQALSERVNTLEALLTLADRRIEALEGLGLPVVVPSAGRRRPERLENLA